MMWVALLDVRHIVTYSSLQHISFLVNIFKNDALLDNLKPTVIKNDVDRFIDVKDATISVSSTRYSNRIRACAKVCF